MAKFHKAALNISVITALSLFGDSLLYPILPLYAEQLGVPLVMVGVVLSINRWVRLFSNHFAARNFSRHSVHLPVVLAALGAAISTGMYAFPIGIVGFLLARMLWGVCFSHFRLGSYLIVLQTSQSVLGWALGLSLAISRLGSAFTTIVGGYFIDKMGYSRTMLALALLSALAVPLAFLLKYQLPKDGQEAEIMPFAKGVTRLGDSSPLSTKLCNASAFVTHLIGSGLVTSSLSLLLQETIGDGIRLGSYWTLGIATVSGLVFSSNWISAILLSATAGKISDKQGRTIPFMVATASQGIMLFLVAATPYPWVSVVASVLFFVLANAQRVFLDAALGDTTTAENRSTLTARYNSFQDFGAALGPLLGYSIATLWGFSQVYTLGALLLIITASLPLVTMGRRQSARM